MERPAAPERAVKRAALMGINLLKVGHHGSREASSKAFLALLSSDCVPILCGRGNSYGHPHVEATECLRRYTGQAHSTAKEGALSMELSSSWKKLKKLTLIY